MKILVSDGNYTHTLGVVRALGKECHTVYVMSHRPGSLAALSKYCADEIIVPKYELPEFNQTFLDILKQYQIDMVMPVGAKANSIMSELQDEIRLCSDIVIAEASKIDVAMSKEKTYALAEKIGVPYPKTFYPLNREEISVLGATLKFPLVIKGKQEAGVNVIDYVEHHRDLLGKYHALCEKHNLEGSLLPMLQEYIKGYGCGFFALYDHGKCCVTFQHRRIREMPPSGGRSVAAETGFNPLVAEYGKQILDALQWHGLAMVEFKVDESGRPFLMEINAKLWGSIELAISAGVNFPQMMVDLHLGKQPAIDVCRKSKLRYTWPFNGDIMYGMLRPKAMCGVIKDTLCLRVKNNCQLSDIRPTIKMAGHFAKTFVKYCVHGQYES